MNSGTALDVKTVTVGGDTKMTNANETTTKKRKSKPAYL